METQTTTAPPTVPAVQAPPAALILLPKAQSPGIIPPPAPPATTRGYYIYASTGHYLAVEFIGWKPVSAIGPLQIADLDKPIDSLDWSKAVKEHGLNVRFLVELDVQEIAFLKSGRRRMGRPVRGTGTGPMGMRLKKAGIPNAG